MRKTQFHPRQLLALALVAVVGLAITIGVTEAQGGRPFSTDLTGAAEFPGPGDENGSGFASITLNQGLGQVCFDLSVSGIEPANAAHIHAGAAGVAGPVVVGLTAPTGGTSTGCIEGVDPNIIKDIRQNPENYYVNVHNADFPSGVVRGQLAK